MNNDLDINYSSLPLISQFGYIKYTEIRRVGSIFVGHIELQSLSSIPRNSIIVSNVPIVMKSYTGIVNIINYSTADTYTGYVANSNLHNGNYSLEVGYYGIGFCYLGKK